MNFSQSQRGTQMSQSTQRTMQFASQRDSFPTQRSSMFSRPSMSYEDESGDLSKKADECVQYILFCCLSEHKAVVKRADLNKHVLKEHSRQFKTIMKMVEVRLNEVFGIELQAMDNSDKSEKMSIRCKFEYDLNLNKPAVMTSSTTETDKIFLDQFKYSMVMISLALIFMNENEIESGLFWDSMKRLDVNKEEKKHKYLGDIFKFFTSDLVKEGYLEYEMIKGIDPPTYKFKSGYRSKLEITKESILDFVCQVYGGVDVCSPDEWSTQYADAMKEFKVDEIEANNAGEQMDTYSSGTQLTQPTQTQRSQSRQAR